jgi:hypothetical protein
MIRPGANAEAERSPEVWVTADDLSVLERLADR